MPDILLDLVYLGAGTAFLFGSVGYALICDRL